MTLRSLFPLLALLLTTLLVACENPFAPALELPDKSPSRRADPIAPESVLVNFETSYRQKDLDLYLETLDDRFLYTYWETGPSGELVQSTYGLYGSDGDRTKTEMMFSTYTYLYFEYFNISSRTTEFPESGFESDHTWEVRRTSFSLVAQLSNGDIKLAQGYAIFKFRREADGTWRIIRWEDQSFQSS